MREIWEVSFANWDDIQEKLMANAILANCLEAAFTAPRKKIVQNVSGNPRRDLGTGMLETVAENMEA